MSWSVSLHQIDIGYTWLQALQKMREYEQRLIELDAKDSVTAAVAAAQPAPPPPPASQQDTESIASSSAADQASQSSASDFPVSHSSLPLSCKKYLCPISI